MHVERDAGREGERERERERERGREREKIKKGGRVEKERNIAPLRAKCTHIQQYNNTLITTYDDIV